MTRATKLKLGFLAAVLIAALGTYLIWSHFDFNRSVITAIVICLLIPGRVQGWLFRDLLRGRRLLDSGEPELAVKHLECFLKTVHERPWLNHCLWLTWSVYAVNAEAMTLNNLGAAQMLLGMFEESAVSLRAALSLDPKYPIPYVNLAAIAAATGDQQSVQGLLDEAQRLGYSDAQADDLFQKMSSLLAAARGRGVTPRAVVK